MAPDFVAPFIRWALYPAMERLRGNRIREHIRRLEKSAYLSPEELKTLQDEKLRRLLHLCNREVPAYRGRWQPEEIEEDPRACLRRLSPLTKKEYQRQADSFLREGVDKSALIANRSGGSTGEPVHFYLDRTTVEQYEAARWRGLGWWDIHPWSRSVMIWGSPIELDRAADRRYRLRERYLKNRLILSAYRMNPGQAREFARLIETYRPDYIYGYGGGIATLARFLEEQDIRLRHRLKVVVFTAEGMPPEDRSRVERILHAPVAGEYGARDAGILAYQCPEGSAHITAENAILETVDPRTGEPAETGMILVTDLNNAVQPRLRYAVGDWGSLAPEDYRCPCGRTLPVLASLEGREDAVFVAADGSLVHGHLAAHVVREMRGVVQIQLIQKARGHFLVRLVLEPGRDPGETGRRVEQELRRWLGEGTYEMEFTDRIEPAASGKYRYAIREFPLEESSSR